MTFTKEKVVNSIVILCLATFVLWYAIDTHRASSSIENIVLILPVVAIVLCLCLYEFFTQKDMQDESPKEGFSSVIPVMILFTLYILTLEYLGFDVGTVLFLGLFLYFHGEKRLAWILGYSLVYGFVIAYFFSFMLPYPMPMMLLPTDY
jgi:putative tricarboxylic transport membrane protein